MTTKFNMTRDINGYNGFGLQFTDTAYSCTLGASSDTSLTVPDAVGIGGPQIYQGTGKAFTLAIFSYDPGTAVWIALNTTAANPAGASFATTASELNPTARIVQGGDVIHFFTLDSNVDVGVAFYSLA